MNNTHKNLYVLVFNGNKPKVCYFKEQNLYLGKAITTDNLQDATMLTLDEAEIKLSCMNEPPQWEIWEIRSGIVLYKQSKRYIIKQRKAELEQIIRDLESET